MINQLSALINPHVVISYDAIWAAFTVLDSNSPDCNLASEIKGLYSMFCWNATQECGNYKQEGDCFNREHSWPKSWWGGFDVGQNAQTDLFHIYPTDGYVNGLRSNLPLGNVGNPVKYVSTNGSKIGQCINSSPYTGQCFEVADEYKGQLARGYFYMATCYRNVWACCDTDGVNKWTIKPWMEAVLRKWHQEFPVSQREINRNNLIYNNYQKNRNPYIDHPEYLNQISSFAV